MGDINKVKTANRLKAKSVTIEDEEGNIFIKNVTQERAVNLRVDGSKTSTKLKTEDALNKFKVKGSSSKVKVSNSNLSVEKRSETKKEKVSAGCAWLVVSMLVATERAKSSSGKY